MPPVTERATASFHENAGFISSNLSHESTGVEGAVLWIFAGEPTRNQSALGPRILVVSGDRLTVENLADAVAVRLSIPPEVLGTLPPRMAIQAVEFVEVNRDVLVRYWQGDMATGDALDLLVRV